MSRQSLREPDFRLTLAYPVITLTEFGQAEPLAEVDLASPDIVADMRALGAAVTRAGARLTVVLPESEVWRGTLDLTAQTRTEAERRSHAADVLCALLSLPQGSLRAVVGEAPADGGPTPIAAISAATLAETCAFLRNAGLLPDAIIGAGTFPGFATAPRFVSVSPLRRGTLRDYAPRLSGPAAAKALALSAACLALIFTLTLDPADTVSAAPEATPPETAAQADLKTTATPLAAAPSIVAPLAPLAVPRLPSPAKAAALVPPRARPDGLAPLSPPTPIRVAQVAPSIPRPLIVQGTRNMPELAGLKLTDDLSANRVAERIMPRKTLTDAQLAAPRIVSPMPRPDSRTADAPARAAAAPEDRPLRRPGAAAEARPAVTQAALTPESAPRPEARPDKFPALSAAITDAVTRAAAEAPRDTRVASLTVATDATSLLASGVEANRPEPRPDTPTPVRAISAAPLAPKPVAKLAPLAPRPQPQIIRAAAPEPIRVIQPAPVVIRQASLAPQPEVRTPRVARTQSVAQPVRTASTQYTAPQSTAQTAGFVRGGLSLLGVFAGQDGRHALVRLSNGNVKRVRQGDSIQGAQVASVSSDSVRLSGGGRETVLKMAE